MCNARTAQGGLVYLKIKFFVWVQNRKKIRMALCFFMIE